MDRALINAFVHQQDIGNRVNGSFTSKALENVVNEVSEKFPDVKLDKEKVKNRIKYIKKEFIACYDVFKNISGITWKEDLSMWQAALDVWDDLIKKHPQVAVWRNNPIPNYNSLCLSYGVDRATLEEAEIAREMRERIRGEQEETRANTIEEIDHMVLNDEIRLEGYDTPPNAEGRKRVKRKIALVEEVTFVKKSFQIAADAIAKVAAEMVKIQPATDTVKSQEKSPVSKTEIWKLLEELKLNAVELHKAYIFLIKNPEMLDDILNCPSSELSERRNLLFEMMK
ncbi:Myb/SANT-like DNA-binding domain protein [Rhynchospora pubera]|uniref:Myb/SANT-like DNA-binding domain protein n=1 Tax=Rhynchospora pubera TaxID=906938 RepID=A0AAV8D9W5_9POAL|nr:Myb/SANT-like DNA-binding domain protein [Rhynchospora pubera]